MTSLPDRSPNRRIFVTGASSHIASAVIPELLDHGHQVVTYDIGVLYRLALEKAPAGSTFHGVGDLGIPFKVIAETIAGKLGIETKSITEEEAPQYLEGVQSGHYFD